MRLLMRTGHLLTLLGLLLLAIGLMEHGWLLLGAWLGGNFLALGIAHGLGAHGLFGKRADGSLPLWSRLAFLPLLAYTTGVWRLLRLGREPAWNAVTDTLAVGRRLLPPELAGPFDNYVDLTAEFAEPAAIRRLAAYRCFPILDGSAPDPEALREAVGRLRPGRTLVHCAQGHGRTGLFALAVLLQSGAAPSAEEGLRMLRAVRPGIHLNRTQRECIETFAAKMTGEAVEATN
jgi:hypothetical protein